MESTDIDAKYSKAKELNEFTEDPETEPYKSKYEARVILQSIKDDIRKKREFDEEKISLIAVEAAIEYKLGMNYIHAEEISVGQECLTRVLELCTDELISLPELLSTAVASCNELGLIWSSRESGMENALEYLKKAESLYQAYSYDAAPYTIDDHFLSLQANEIERKALLENLHTYTLFYLAQVYKTLGKADVSASYCMNTLQRQLSQKSYKPLEWSLNCACLSQYFITCSKFFEARHCLSCASFIAGQVEENAEEDSSKIPENLADISRCWVKYCLCLLENSKNNLENENSVPNNEAGDEKFDVYFALEVTSIEEKVPYQLCGTYEHAKSVFLLGKQHAAFALTYFVLDGFVTDYVEINQDISRLYQHIAFFESSVDLRCRMYKRRIDILLELLGEINPQYYLAVCRQLQFETAEVYTDMMDMKLSKYTSDRSNQTPHAKKKINFLCNASIQYFHEFLKTLKGTDGKFPERFEDDIERVALVAHFHIARLYSKLLTTSNEEKFENLKMSLSYYTFVTTYTNVNIEAKSKVYNEMEICREMVDVLPKTMDKLVSSLSSN